VKGTVDTVEGVKKTVNDVQKDLGHGENSENGSESEGSNGNGESEASFMSADEIKVDSFVDFVQNWILYWVIFLIISHL